MNEHNHERTLTWIDNGTITWTFVHLNLQDNPLPPPPPESQQGTVGKPILRTSGATNANMQMSAGQHNAKQHPFACESACCPVNISPRFLFSLQTRQMTQSFASCSLRPFLEAWRRKKFTNFIQIWEIKSGNMWIVDPLLGFLSSVMKTLYARAGTQPIIGGFSKLWSSFTDEQSKFIKNVVEFNKKTLKCPIWI